MPNPVKCEADFIVWENTKDCGVFTIDGEEVSGYRIYENKSSVTLIWELPKSHEALVSALAKKSWEESEIAYDDLEGFESSTGKGSYDFLENGDEIEDYENFEEDGDEDVIGFGSNFGPNEVRIYFDNDSCVVFDGDKIDKLLNHLQKENKTWDAFLEELSDVESADTDPEKYLTDDLYRKLDPFIDAPDNIKNKDFCLKALEMNPDVMEHVPDSIKNNDFYREALKVNADLLEVLPKEILDRNLCFEAVNDSGWVLEHIPDELKDKELCVAAVNSHGTALEYVPDHLKDKEICLVAVEKAGAFLRFVPANLVDKELCLAAVSTNGQALEFVPNEMKEMDVCLAAVKSEGDWALEFVPEELKKEVKKHI